MHAQIDSLIMKDLKQFNIPFVGLKLGDHSFEYQIDNTFFEAFDFSEFNSSAIKAAVTLVKKSTMLELDFTITGYVNVNCDTSLEPYDQEINGNFSLIVKFGPEFNDDNDEILVLPHEEYQINIGQYLYELIVLSIPNRKVHPKVLDGTMDSEALRKLKELEIKQDTTAEKTVDPRWDKLKDLITEKKTEDGTS